MADSLFNPSSLYERLSQANLLPLWSRRYPGAGISGEYNTSTNDLMALPANEGKAEKTTLSHELTHASQHNFLYPALEAIAKKKNAWAKITPEEEQYYVAAKKLLNTQPGTVGQYSPSEAVTNRQSLDKVIKAMYKDTPAFKPYRTGLNELQAHGIGNMTQGGLSGGEKAQIFGSAYNQHLDPTMATEFSVLMGLFDKLPENIKQDIIAKRTKSIESNKQFYSNRDATKPYYKFSSITEDPFAPTIK